MFSYINKLHTKNADHCLFGGWEKTMRVGFNLSLQPVGRHRCGPPSDNINNGYACEIQLWLSSTANVNNNENSYNTAYSTSSVRLFDGLCIFLFMEPLVEIEPNVPPGGEALTCPICVCVIGTHNSSMEERVVKVPGCHRARSSASHWSVPHVQHRASEQRHRRAAFGLRSLIRRTTPSDP